MLCSARMVFGQRGVFISCQTSCDMVLPSRARDRPPQSLRSITAIDVRRPNTKGRTVDFSRLVSCSSDQLKPSSKCLTKSCSIPYFHRTYIIKTITFLPLNSWNNYTTPAVVIVTELVNSLPINVVFLAKTFLHSFLHLF